jgi:serine/threonine-protein kinase
VDGQLYLSMEYVQGKTLSRLAYRLRQLGKTVPLGVLLHLGQRLCEALAYAHDATDEAGNPLHLVHRDLSPANVCISYAGEVKVIDFGAAQSTLKLEQTQPRVVIGNLTYMAPEQARKRPVDRRADLYALGVLLWELTAWRPLPQRGDPVERWHRAAYPEWEPAGTYRKGVPPALDALLMKALSSEPSARFPDARAMGAELARLKAKLTPNCAGDADVARLMASAFPREKAMEETVLRELLEAPPRRRTSREVAVLIPPNALAFEHSGIETPEGFLPPARGGTALFGAVGAEGAPAAVAEDGEATVPAGRPGADADLEVTVPAGRPRAAAEGAEVTVPEGRPGAVPPPDVTVPMQRLGLQATGAPPPDVTVPMERLGPVVPGLDAKARLVAARLAATGDPADGEVTVPPRGRAGEATEALEASKVLVAIARSEAARSSGPKPMPQRTRTADTVTPVMPPRATGSRAAQPRVVARETQVGFGLDISQQVNAEAVEARRLELVRAVTGDGDMPVVPAWRGRRVWRAAGLVAGVCAAGLGVAWMLVGR